MGELWQALQSVRDALWKFASLILNGASWLASALHAHVKATPEYAYAIAREWPRILLLAFILLITWLSIIVLEAPAALLCSDFPNADSCRLFSIAEPNWTVWLGSWMRMHILCAIAAGSKCTDGMNTSDTQSAFQALFGFALALNLIADVWRKCGVAFRRLPEALDKLVRDISELAPSEAAGAKQSVERRRTIWVPAYRALVTVTVGAIHFSFMLTAAVAGFILMIPFVTSHADKLPFGISQVVMFAMCPFFAIGLLHIDRIIVQSIVVRTLAPILYWRRYWLTIYAEGLELRATGLSPGSLRKRIRFWIAERLHYEPPKPQPGSA